MTIKQLIQQDIITDKKPIIAFTTNKLAPSWKGFHSTVSQLALAAYKWNPDTDRYEIQDSIFMLAKQNPEEVTECIARTEPSSENIERILKDEFMYIFTHKDKADLIKLLKKRIDLKDQIEAHIAGSYQGRFSLIVLQNRLKDVEAKIDAQRQVIDEKEKVLAMYTREEILDTPEAKAYYEDPKKIKDTLIDLKGIDIQKYLAEQGISLDEYKKGEIGLTSEEIQTGIDEFLKQYKTADTVFLTDNMKVEKHYLDKGSMSIIDPDFDKCVDLYSMGKGVLKRILDLKASKHIQVTDAFTKTLLCIQVFGGENRLMFSNSSLEQVVNDVKFDTFKNDNNYVMSLSSILNKNWKFVDGHIRGFYNFSSLEHVTFGNDRRYVDIDKMFEVNNNFEITLEGTKEPIKSWEELEAKIKALNSDISETLLNKIKEKYEETRNLAEKKKEEKTVSEFFKAVEYAKQKEAEEGPVDPGTSVKHDPEQVHDIRKESETQSEETRSSLTDGLDDDFSTAKILDNLNKKIRAAENILAESSNYLVDMIEDRMRYIEDYIAADADALKQVKQKLLNSNLSSREINAILNAHREEITVNVYCKGTSNAGDIWQVRPTKTPLSIVDFSGLMPGSVSKENLEAAKFLRLHDGEFFTDDKCAEICRAKLKSLVDKEPFVLFKNLFDDNLLLDIKEGFRSKTIRIAEAYVAKLTEKQLEIDVAIKDVEDPSL